MYLTPSGPKYLTPVCFIGVHKVTRPLSFVNGCGKEAGFLGIDGNSDSVRPFTKHHDR